jgi:hypothetical protein
MGDHFGVSGCLELDAVVLELFPEGQCVDYVAVVGEGELAPRAVDEEWLSVVDAARARGRVTSVPDGDVAGEALEIGLVEGLVHEPHARVDAHSRAVGGGDSSALLAAMLQREETKKGNPGYVLTRGENAEYTATLVEAFEQPGSLDKG